MSGHTFKVGDRVHWSAETVARVVVAEPDKGGRILVLTDDGRYLPILEDVLLLLPLFEPVERWIFLRNDGELGYGLQDFKGKEKSTFGGWVKVLISPAEDQS